MGDATRPRGAGRGRLGLDWDSPPRVPRRASTLEGRRFSPYPPPSATVSTPPATSDDRSPRVPRIGRPSDLTEFHPEEVFRGGTRGGRGDGPLQLPQASGGGYGGGPLQTRPRTNPADRCPQAGSCLPRGGRTSPSRCPTLLKGTWTSLAGTLDNSDAEADRPIWRPPRKPRDKFIPSKRPGVSTKYYRLASDHPTEHLPLDADWTSCFPQATKPYPSSQMKRLEAWEDNVAASLAIVNHSEWFHSAVVNRLAGLVKHMEDLVLSLSEQAGENDTPLLPQMETWMRDVRLTSHLSNSHAKATEDLASRLQWQQFDLQAARRDVYVESLPREITSDVKDCLRHLPPATNELFGGKCREALDLIEQEGSGLFNHGVPAVSKEELPLNPNRGGEIKVGPSLSHRGRGMTIKARASKTGTTSPGPPNDRNTPFRGRDDHKGGQPHKGQSGNSPDDTRRFNKQGYQGKRKKHFHRK